MFLKGKHFKFIVLLQTTLKVKSTQEENYSQKLFWKHPCFIYVHLQFHVIKKCGENSAFCTFHEHYARHALLLISDVLDPFYTHCASHLFSSGDSLYSETSALVALGPGALLPPPPKCKCTRAGTWPARCQLCKAAVVPDAGGSSVSNWMNAKWQSQGLQSQCRAKFLFFGFCL